MELVISGEKVLDYFCHGLRLIGNALKNGYRIIIYYVHLYLTIGNIEEHEFLSEIHLPPDHHRAFLVILCLPFLLFIVYELDCYSGHYFWER